MTDTFDAKTCTARDFETDTYPVKVIAVGCNQNKPPRSFLLEIHASGPLTI